MFTTQLTGLLKRISEKEDFSIEDAGRLLAQALISEGTIYMKGFGEMAVIEAEALDGAETLSRVQRWTPSVQLTDADRVLIASRFTDDADALELAKNFADAGVSFASIASKRGESGIDEWADAFINIQLTKGILPDDEGGRTGFPSSIAGLYAYFLLKMTIDEIVNEYE